MWLIDRGSDGAGRRIPVPDHYRDTLVRWYSGAGTSRDEAAAMILVQQARARAKWIACDCLGPKVTPPILTSAYLSEAETYYLRRLTSPDRAEHREDCPFFREQATNRVTEVRSHATPVDAPSGFFEVLRPAPEHLARKPELDSTDDRTRNASIPRLARLLLNLMRVSGLNQIPPLPFHNPAHSIGDEFKALLASAGKIEIAPGVQLSRALWTHANALHGGQVHAALRRLAGRWPKGHAPQAFLTLFSPGFHGNVIGLAGADPIEVVNRVQSPSVRSNIIRGPWLVIVVVGRYPDSQDYKPLRAYAQPIYSGHWFVPVDSAFERRVLRALLVAQRDLADAGVDIVIDKPVFDTMTPLGPCRPDFIVTARSRETGEMRRIVVEAMGFETEDYLASKAVTHPRMAQIGPVLTVDGDDEKAGAIPRLVAAALG